MDSKPKDAGANEEVTLSLDAAEGDQRVLLLPDALSGAMLFSDVAEDHILCQDAPGEEETNAMSPNGTADQPMRIIMENTEQEGTIKEGSPHVVVSSKQARICNFVPSDSGSSSDSAKSIVCEFPQSVTRQTKASKEPPSTVSCVSDSTPKVSPKLEGPVVIAHKSNRSLNQPFVSSMNVVKEWRASSSKSKINLSPEFVPKRKFDPVPKPNQRFKSDKNTKMGPNSKFGPSSEVLNMDDLAFLERHYTVESCFKEKNVKDVPCRFHDGFSEDCYKGPWCPKSHKKYTGGIFAKHYPEVALAHSLSVKRTPLSSLLKQDKWHVNLEFECGVTYAVSPNEFYIVPEGGKAVCKCQLLEAKLEARRRAENPAESEMDDAYAYGFSGLEGNEDLQSENARKVVVEKTVNEKLNDFLRRGATYTGFQQHPLKPMVELVAARTHGVWKRGYILWERPVQEGGYKTDIRVQVIDTGEKVTLTDEDVCRLPEEFAAEPAAAFRCFLFGVSPTWEIWTKSGREMFCKLVEGKRLRVIIKDCSSESLSRQVYETTYVTQVFYKNPDLEAGNKWIDVAKMLIAAGQGIEWNLIPRRPFSRQVMDTSGLPFLFKSNTCALPPAHLELEQKRLKELPDEETQVYNPFERPSNVENRFVMNELMVHLNDTFKMTSEWVNKVTGEPPDESKESDSREPSEPNFVVPPIDDLIPEENSSCCAQERKKQEI